MYNETFRKVALLLYSYLGNMKKVALALKIGIGTVWRWVRLGIQSNPRFPLAFPDAMVSIVEFFVTENNHSTHLDIQKEIQRCTGNVVSRHCIASILKGLGMTRKRLRKRGKHPRNVPLLTFKTFKEYISKATRVVSIDEVGFDQRMTPIYAFTTTKGTKAIAVTHPTARVRTTMIMAIDRNGQKAFTLVDNF
jgi:hypothetical protein